MKQHRSLEELVIQACPRTWDSLEPVGEPAVWAGGSCESRRYCDDCQLAVHNLSAYTRREARRLLDSPGRVCVMKSLRPDGSVVTRATWSERASQRVRALASRAALLFVSLWAGLLASCSGELEEQAREASVEGGAEQTETGDDRAGQECGQGTSATGELNEEPLRLLTELGGLIGYIGE